MFHGGLVENADDVVDGTYFVEETADAAGVDTDDGAGAIAGSYLAAGSTGAWGADQAIEYTQETDDADLWGTFTGPATESVDDAEQTVDDAWGTVDNSVGDVQQTVDNAAGEASETLTELAPEPWHYVVGFVGLALLLAAVTGGYGAGKGAGSGAVGGGT